MDLYDFLLFVHIFAAIIWLGSGFFSLVLATRADRATDDEMLAKLLGELGKLANVLFIPASLTVLILGIVMTIDRWAFDQLWIILALVGYAGTFVTGAVVLGPGSEKLGKALERDGQMLPETRAAALKMLAISRIDFVVLVLVVFDMAVKPSGDDVGVLVGMALALVLGAAAVFMRVRQMDAGATLAT